MGPGSKLRSGSRGPQFGSLDWVAVGMAVGVSVTAESSVIWVLERFLPLPPFPSAFGAAFLTTAVRSAALRLVAYVIWPSFAPFSIGPGYVKQKDVWIVRETDL